MNVKNCQHHQVISNPFYVQGGSKLDQVLALPPSVGFAGMVMRSPAAALVYVTSPVLNNVTVLCSPTPNVLSCSPLTLVDHGPSAVILTRVVPSKEFA